MSKSALERFKIHPVKDGDGYEVWWETTGAGEVCISCQSTKEHAKGYIADLAANEGISKLLNVCSHIQLTTQEEAGRTQSILDATEIIELLKEAGHTVSELEGHRLRDRTVIKRWIAEVEDVVELIFID